MDDTLPPFTIIMHETCTYDMITQDHKELLLRPRISLCVGRERARRRPVFSSQATTTRDDVPPPAARPNRRDRAPARTCRRPRNPAPSLYAPPRPPVSSRGGAGRSFAVVALEPRCPRRRGGAGRVVPPVLLGTVPPSVASRGVPVSAAVVRAAPPCNFENAELLNVLGGHGDAAGREGRIGGGALESFWPPEHRLTIHFEILADF